MEVLTLMALASPLMKRQRMVRVLKAEINAYFAERRPPESQGQIKVTSIMLMHDHKVETILQRMLKIRVELVIRIRERDQMTSI